MKPTTFRRLEVLERPGTHRHQWDSLIEAHEEGTITEKDFVILATSWADTHPFLLEKTLRGRVPDERVRKAYTAMRNYAYPQSIRMRILERAGCIAMVDGEPVLQPGYVLLPNSPTDDPWDGSIVDA